MKRMTRFVLAAILISGALVLLAPLASQSPDGLEHVVETHGTAPAAANADETEAAAPPAWALFPDYGWRSGGGALGTIVAGLAGTALVLLAGFGLGKALARRAPQKNAPGPD